MGLTSQQNEILCPSQPLQLNFMLSRTGHSHIINTCSNRTKTSNMRWTFEETGDFELDGNETTLCTAIMALLNFNAKYCTLV